MVTELSQPTQFVDGGDGLDHRTAWAGVGDGVLFFDVGGDGAITEQREYVFTEWDPTAASAREALRSYFDTNGDGKLDANDDGWLNSLKPNASQLHRKSLTATNSSMDRLSNP